MGWVVLGLAWVGRVLCGAAVHAALLLLGVCTLVAAGHEDFGQVVWMLLAVPLGRLAWGSTLAAPALVFTASSLRVDGQLLLATPSLLTPVEPAAFPTQAPPHTHTQPPPALASLPPQAARNIFENLFGGGFGGFGGMGGGGGGGRPNVRIFTSGTSPPPWGSRKRPRSAFEGEPRSPPSPPLCPPALPLPPPCRCCCYCCRCWAPLLAQLPPPMRSVPFVGPTFVQHAMHGEITNNATRLALLLLQEAAAAAARLAASAEEAAAAGWAGWAAWAACLGWTVIRTATGERRAALRRAAPRCTASQPVLHECTVRWGF